MTDSAIQDLAVQDSAIQDLAVQDFSITRAAIDPRADGARRLVHVGATW